MNRQIICCGMPAVENSVEGKKFWYCRECKKEVTDTVEPVWDCTPEYEQITKKLWGTFRVSFTNEGTYEND